MIALQTNHQFIPLYVCYRCIKTKARDMTSASTSPKVYPPGHLNRRIWYAILKLRRMLSPVSFRGPWPCPTQAQAIALIVTLMPRPLAPLPLRHVKMKIKSGVEEFSEPGKRLIYSSIRTVTWRKEIFSRLLYTFAFSLLVYPLGNSSNCYTLKNSNLSVSNSFRKSTIYAGSNEVERAKIWNGNLVKILTCSIS